MSTKLKKKRKKKTDTKKRGKKCSNYLLFIVIDRFGDQFTLESVNSNFKSWFKNQFSSTRRSNAQNLMSLIFTFGGKKCADYSLPVVD